MERIDEQPLAEALAEIGTFAVQAGKVIDLAVYGGSCLNPRVEFSPEQLDRSGRRKGSDRPSSI